MEAVARALGAHEESARLAVEYVPPVEHVYAGGPMYTGRSALSRMLFSVGVTVTRAAAAAAPKGNPYRIYASSSIAAWCALSKAGLASRTEMTVTALWIMAALTALGYAALHLFGVAVVLDGVTFS